MNCNCPECQQRDIDYWNRQKKFWGTLIVVFVIFFFWLCHSMNVACIEAGIYPDVCGF